MSDLRLLFLGQSGIVLRHGGETLVVDPYLTDAVADASEEPALWRRAFPPPAPAEAIEGVVAIACTHEHADHADPGSIASLLSHSPDAIVLAPEHAHPLLQDVVPPERLRASRGELDHHSFGSFTLTAVPAAHSDRYVVEHDHRGHRWQGFVIEAGGCRVYHAGDTVAYEGQAETLRDLGPIDAALLPINGRDAVRERHDVVGNLWPREAVDLALQIGAPVLIPLHHDLFPFNGIAPGELVDHVLARGDPLEIRLLVAGAETVITPTDEEDKQ